jgi:hypothetical protein
MEAACHGASEGEYSVLLRFFVAALAVAALAGCATKANSQIDALKRPAGQPRIILMPVDVELSELTAGGLHEPKADWTEGARRNLTAAFQTEKTALGLNVIAFDDSALPQERRDALNQISKLHGAIGQTIQLNQYINAAQLPTKGGRMDWTLGESVRELRAAQDADYAMFVFVRDTYASAGRAALMVAAAVLGVGLQGGSQIGFVSLVDLDTGNIVWFNRLVRGSGDLRTPEPARETALTLLTGLPK